MTLTYESSSGKTLVCRFESDRTGYLNSLRFEIRDRHILFYDGEKQIFPADTSIYSAVRKFKAIANNQLREVA